MDVRRCADVLKTLADFIAVYPAIHNTGVVVIIIRDNMGMFRNTLFWHCCLSNENDFRYCFQFLPDPLPQLGRIELVIALSPFWFRNDPAPLDCLKSGFDRIFTPAM